MPHTSEVIEEAVTAISRHRFRYPSEAHLQSGLFQVLSDAGLEPRREVRVNAGSDRLDFMLKEGVAVEVKVKGSLAALTRQVHRYAQHPEVKVILIITTKSAHQKLNGQLVRGKPIKVIHLLTL